MNRVENLGEKTRDLGGLSLRLADRSYKEYNITIYYEHKFHRNRRIGTAFINRLRNYGSKISEDQLHLNRRHYDCQISIWYTFYINTFRNI